MRPHYEDMTPPTLSLQRERLRSEMVACLRSLRTNEAGAHEVGPDELAWACVVTSLQWRDVLMSLFSGSHGALNLEGFGLTFRTGLTVDLDVESDAVFIGTLQDMRTFYVSDLPDGAHEIYTQLRNDNLPQEQARETALLLAGSPTSYHANTPS